MSEKLKRCPFCGHSDIDPAEWMNRDGITGPACSKCNAMADSVEAWNRRTAPQPAPATGDIDVTKVPGYVTPQQASETAAAHAKGGVPRDPCDCASCVKMRGHLYGDLPAASAQQDNEPRCGICGAKTTDPWLDHRGCATPPSQPIDMGSSGGEREAFESAYSAMMNAQSIAERWGAEPYTAAEIAGMREGDSYRQGRHVLNACWALWHASAAHRREDQRDAERYRFIRETTKAVRDDDGGGRIEVTPEDFDSMTDAAMQRTAAPAHGENGAGGEGQHG